MIPDWWHDGAKVIGLQSELGSLYGGDDGVPWTVLLDSAQTIYQNPDPKYWFRRPTPQISTMQLRRILYEADRAFVASCGRSSMTEWISVPESSRAAAEAPHCAPLVDDGVSSIRRVMEAALVKVLAPYVNPYST